MVNNFPSASETKNDYFRFNAKDSVLTRSKIIYSPNTNNPINDPYTDNF